MYFFFNVDNIISAIVDQDSKEVVVFTPSGEKIRYWGDSFTAMTIKSKSGNYLLNPSIFTKS